ncbi:hypothetical protein TrLO_g15663 [Triparma laevis f. longispina]|uniref:Glutathione S-transferase n=1 Tax=Triparma laevis f. longispina TaxID=1714387 RepID=A0A9W7L062_9STRA|nr:hypothetical protein TrLO_g15663 [Triparma laevis f. longispina]
MPMRNRCETSRLILEDASIPYTFEVIGWNPWIEGVKSEYPRLGKLPVLKGEGLDYELGNEQSIVRYLAKKHGYAGSSLVEESRYDEYYQQFWTTLRNNGLTHDGDSYSPSSLVGIEKRECPSYGEIRRLNDEGVVGRSLAALKVFEDALKESGTGFIVGEKISYVDLAVFYCLIELTEEDMVPDFAERFGLTELGKFIERMLKREKIRDYIFSERRMPRYKRPGYTFCSSYGSNTFNELLGSVEVTGQELSDGWKARTQEMK